MPKLCSKALPLLVAAFSIRSPAFAEEEKISAIGYSGVSVANFSDDFLIKLGTAAESFLIKRLEEEPDHRFLPGIIDRLNYFQGVGTPNPRIFSALRNFVETHSQKNEKCLASSIPLSSALRVIPHKGGEEGIDYLAAWLTTDKFISRVKCGDGKRFFGSKRALAISTSELRHAAAAGLGESGNPRALEILLNVQEKPPKMLDQQSFLSTVREAIETNKKIQTFGIASVFPTRYDPFKKRGMP